MADNDMQAVIDTARATLAPASLGGYGFYLPHGRNGSGEVIDAERFAVQPIRPRGETVVFDAASLNILINDNPGVTNVYVSADLRSPSIVAVFNDTVRGVPGWGDHRASIEFRPTVQWQKWCGIDGKLMSQVDFAEFVEDNLDDITDPVGATMLEIATYLEATKTTAFKSGIRLSNGTVQFQNTSNVDAKVGAGSIEVPETITLGIKPFIGSKLYAVPVRFRYRLEEGKLRLGVVLQRREDLVQAVVNDTLAAIEFGTDVFCLQGRAADPIKARDVLIDHRD